MDAGLCRRRNWPEPAFDVRQGFAGFRCTVGVNGRDFAAPCESPTAAMAMDQAACQAYIYCRDFSKNAGGASSAPQASTSAPPPPPSMSLSPQTSTHQLQQHFHQQQQHHQYLAYQPHGLQQRRPVGHPAPHPRVSAHGNRASPVMQRLSSGGRMADFSRRLSSSDSGSSGSDRRSSVGSAAGLAGVCACGGLVYRSFDRCENCLRRGGW